MASSPRPQDAVLVGQIVLGKYRIERVVGTGGMGVVAECTHIVLQERMALKMLRQDIVVDRDVVERFTREAQAAAKLKSEYVARVFDVGVLENGTPFMVMEFLEGHDLGDLLKERGCLPVQWATQFILQTCEALAEAHSLGIVHRDVKPTNLFVTWRPDGTSLIKVLDFGISKATSAQDMHLTQTQSLLGTPAYMSPEQMRSARNVDARTDIWSLGTVLYELIEGRKPFEAESFSEMCVKVAVDPPAPMRNAPRELANVLMRCLAKTPDQRYPSMAELARDLIPFAQDPQQAAVSVERMMRIMRRTQDAGGWEGLSTGVGMRSAPHHIRDVNSAPVRHPSASPFGAGTDPSGVGLQPWLGGSEPSAPMFRNTPIPGMPQSPEGGAPHTARPDTTSAPANARTQHRERGYGMVIFALLLLATGGIALAFGLAGDDTPATPPITTSPSTPSMINEPPTPNKGETPMVAPEVKPETKPEGVVKPKGTPEVKPEAKPEVQKTGGIKTGKTGGTKTIKNGGGAIKTTTSKVETHKVETPKVEPTKVEPKTTCDPFANPHGCNKKK
ncbi:MAG: protein kinase [Kofleriaceae bacterium]|nr:protein kinase [Kofleriaceae bacterium]